MADPSGFPTSLPEALRRERQDGDLVTRARNGAAEAAPARAVSWHVIPDDDDRGPSRTFPACADGDELLARLPSGEVVQVTVDRRGGVYFRGPDGEAVEPDAIARRPSRRSGTRLTEVQRLATCERAERLQVRLRPGYVARLRALAESDGYTMAEWIETWVEMSEREAHNHRISRHLWPPVAFVDLYG